MFKKTIQFCLFTILISFSPPHISKADTSIKETKEADTTKTINKNPPTQKIAGAKTSDSESVNDNKPKQNIVGPPYPFIYEKTDKDQLACKATTFIEPEYTNMKSIKKGNNLMRKPGSALRAGGNYIQINGIIVDENCLPIQGAVIEIWQTDANGRYEWEYDTTNYWELPTPGKDNHFLFSGSAQTDNLGEFNILTIFPGSKADNAPYINIIVKRVGYDELHTRMYFADHPRNDTDKTILSMNKEEKISVIAPGRNIDPKGVYEGRVYYFPITMTGISTYKRF